MSESDAASRSVSSCHSGAASTCAPASSKRADRRHRSGRELRAALPDEGVIGHREQALPQGVAELDPPVRVHAHEALLTPGRVQQHGQLEPPRLDLQVARDTEPVPLALDLDAQGLRAHGRGDERLLVEPLDLEPRRRLAQRGDELAAPPPCLPSGSRTAAPPRRPRAEAEQSPRAPAASSCDQLAAHVAALAASRRAAHLAGPLRDGTAARLAPGRTSSSSSSDTSGSSRRRTTVSRLRLQLPPLQRLGDDERQPRFEP